MKKIILTFIMALIALSSFRAQSLDVLSLDDFGVEEMFAQKQNSSYYKLTLLNSKDPISVNLIKKPDKIVSSFFDNKYMVFVYKNRSSYYLTGAYKSESNWKQDYFNIKLGLSIGISSKEVKTVKFLDGETLLLSYEFFTTKNKEKKTIYSILRICQNQIYEYKRFENNNMVGPKGDNSIRPRF